MTDWIYSDKVKEHFFDPKNVLMEEESSFDYNARGLVGNVICGDQMLMLLKIEKDVVQDVRWKTYGCASAIASTSILSEVVKGMTISEAFWITPEIIAKKLGGLPANKFHCSVLGDKALRSAINNYLEKTGREKLEEKDSKVICNCLGITDKDIENAYLHGARTWEDMQAATKIGTACGGCKKKTMDIIKECSKAGK
jgi:NifU homolog involved in Fe-S cluster formation